MQNNEISIIQCKDCKELKTRHLAGKWGNCKKWVDGQGKLFNGKICPECKLKRSKEGMQKIRTLKKEVEGLVNVKSSDNT